MIIKKKHYILSSVVGIALKVMVIFGFFIILKNLNVFPEKIVLNLQKAMSVMQLVTATIGCIISYCIYRIELNKTASN